MDGSDRVGGFDFQLCRRNKMMQSKGFVMPGALKTGTTIVGVMFNEGIVLAADTRATEGSVIADKNCEKIHYIAPNIYCCGAGTAADTEFTTNLISSQLSLLRLDMGRESRVASALTLLKRYLFKYQGHVSAALVLGGVDFRGPHLYTVYPHGSTDELPFVTMGSGSLAAMAVFESGFMDGMGRDQAIKLARDAIRAGIFNDLGSGSNVDICVIERGHTEMMRNYETPNPRRYRMPGGYEIPVGTTRVLKMIHEKIVVEDGDTMALDGE
uniref:Proteasome subunit beta n=1 Tax=Stygiella incarcerata TaxID=1712417 RepID=A0A192ZI15_9EUKA|nr:proteasome subunit beta type-7-B [Stygiella incarcerata]